ncbi:acyl-CoA dehydratase activase [Tissierella sp. Yu-01]|uniref:acyl-CoA dehydratase activase n=1 Tax=Tissierella sp. Yu-01 TaxID=3035694 RepID=UPI00240CEF16|nr:acyl-CoA dehydratase activase [Tissierella sp. Yu-01]WFA08432.1 acyl-CoA dehydratase activase [Tissierella sp. Yu-01]
MHYIGIDIGSTAAKVSVFEEERLVTNFNMPTGWSSIEASRIILEKLEELKVSKEEARIIATGYGRVSVPYADKTLTEITCHGKGAYYLLGKDCTVIDIGGQDTKIITVENDRVTDFTMNDKCAAGTGRFLELMANSLAINLPELAELSLKGEEISITSMCTVFAESEVISLMGKGTPREDIARGVINSITGRVSTMLYKHGVKGTIYLTGGLCEISPFIELLSEKLDKEVITNPLGRYAGSIGAALMGQ